MDMLFKTDVGAPAAAAFEAITTTEGLASFWTSDCEAKPEVGSVARFGFPAAPVDLRMRVDELVPGQRVTWSCLGDFPHWAGTTVTWELGPATQGEGSSVFFRHGGWGPDYPESEYSSVAFVWGQVVARLKEHLETGRRDPFLG
jgi:uncharacterized protein YndB with AHSA1/START domain